MKIVRVTDSVEIRARPGGPAAPVLTLSRDEPGAADHGRRNPSGYVTVTFDGEGVFSLSDLRAALVSFDADFIEGAL